MPEWECYRCGEVYGSYEDALECAEDDRDTEIQDTINRYSVVDNSTDTQPVFVCPECGISYTSREAAEDCYRDCLRDAMRVEPEQIEDSDIDDYEGGDIDDYEGGRCEKIDISKIKPKSEIHVKYIGENSLHEHLFEISQRHSATKRVSLSDKEPPLDINKMVKKAKSQFGESFLFMVVPEELKKYMKKTPNKIGISGG